MNGNITNTETGTIIVNKYAEVGPAVVNEGRIEIIYGGVAKTTTPEGVIFYTVKGNEAAYQINNLMTDGKVNTFVVNSGVTFDLNNTDINGVNSDEYDPFEGTPEILEDTELALVKIEMNGGAVKGRKNGVQSTVDEIEVISGETNLITDLKADLITATAGTLTMDATTYLVGTTLHKYVLNMNATTVDVKAGATLIANANTHVNVLNNAGTVKANATYLFHYNSGVNTGTLTGEVEKCDCPVPDSAEVVAVKSTWETLNGVLNLTTYDELITKVASFIAADWAKTEDAGIGVKFVRALSAWLVSEGYDAITETAPVTITKMQLKAFENATGYSFGLN